MEGTKIEWADHTWNPWIGCQKVSPGCDHCYAEDLNARYGWTEWGPHGDRRRTAAANWRKPLAWNARAVERARRERVFSGSLCDVFDRRADQSARADLWELIRSTPALDWLLLTKRPQNIAGMLPDGWADGWPNVWLGMSAENQTEYDRRWPHLAAAPAAVRFISYEPVLGPLSIRDHDTRPDWLIWGGESGPKARPMDPECARRISHECERYGVAVFGKQWGTYASNPLVVEEGKSVADARRLDPPANGKGGGLLFGRLWREFPKDSAEIGNIASLPVPDEKQAAQLDLAL